MAAFVGVDFPAGMKMIESIHLGTPIKSTVRRTFRERFFSRPWKPWVTTKVITETMPDPNIYTFGDLIICHPMVASHIRERFLHDKSGGFYTLGDRNET